MTTEAGPLLVTVGGFPGCGKTTIARRLLAELGIPRLGSDTIGRTIKAALGSEDATARASHAAYAVLFTLAEEFVRAGVSTVLDVNLGWEFQWRHLDELQARNLMIRA